MAKSFDTLTNETMTESARERSDERAREIMAELLLSELRRSVGLSQAELATALGMKQPTLSRLENQDDMYVSTLHRLIIALGGELEFIAHFPQGDIRLTQFREHLAKAGDRAQSPKIVDTELTKQT
jgi:transcriptional regulator with XRE-family HTH domain